MIQAPGFFRYKLGEFHAIALHDGVLTRDRPSGFVRNADDAAVGAAFAEAGMPADKLTLTFNPLAIETPVWNRADRYRLRRKAGRRRRAIWWLI